MDNLNNNIDNNMNDFNQNAIDPQTLIDDNSQFNQNDLIDYNYDDSQTNLNKSINNHTDIVNNYNQVTNDYIDDTNAINTFEDQINSSQDLNIYTQQPNNYIDEIDYIDEDFNGNYTENKKIMHIILNDPSKIRIVLY